MTKPTGTSLDRPLAADQATIAKRDATQWATGARVDPTDVGFVPVGAGGKSDIYMLPQDAQRYKSGDRNAESLPHLEVQRGANGASETMTSSEAEMTRRLVEQGNRVTRLAASAVPGQESHDFLVNGQRTELWTPTKLGKSEVEARDTIAAGIGKKCGQGGADHVIVDASRLPEVDRDTAFSAASKALDSATKARLKDVRVIGDGFDFTVDRLSVRDNGVK